MSSPTLFDPPDGPGHRLTDPATSVAAAAETVKRPGLRRRILLLHLEQSPRFQPSGMTDDFLCRLLPGQHAGSVSKRRHDLTAAGLVEDSGVTRRTRFGCDAIVWRITDLGRQVAEGL